MDCLTFLFLILDFSNAAFMFEVTFKGSDSVAGAYSLSAALEKVVQIKMESLVTDPGRPLARDTRLSGNIYHKVWAEP